MYRLFFEKTIMKTIIWDTSYFCPLQCVYCYSSSGPHRPQTDAEQILAVAQAIVRERPGAVMISGGEPTYAKGILEAGKMFKDAGIVASIFTSGWAMNPTRIRALCDVFDRVHVSIDASDPEVNDRVRNRKGAHANAMEALRLLGEEQAHNKRLRFGVECTVIRENLGGIAQFVRAMFAVPGLSFINIVAAVPSGRGADALRCETQLLGADDVRQLSQSVKALQSEVPPTLILTLNDTDFLQNDGESCVQLDPKGNLRAIKICDKTVGNLIDEPLDVLMARALEWRKNSELAKQLTKVSGFVAWGDIVRRIDQEATTDGGEAVEGHRHGDSGQMQLHDAH